MSQYLWKSWVVVADNGKVVMDTFGKIPFFLSKKEAVILAKEMTAEAKYERAYYGKKYRSRQFSAVKVSARIDPL